MSQMRHLTCQFLTKQHIPLLTFCIITEVLQQSLRIGANCLLFCFFLCIRFKSNMTAWWNLFSESFSLCKPKHLQWITKTMITAPAGSFTYSTQFIYSTRMKNTNEQKKLSCFQRNCHLIYNNRSWKWTWKRQQHTTRGQIGNLSKCNTWKVPGSSWQAPHIYKWKLQEKPKLLSVKKMIHLLLTCHTYYLKFVLLIFIW